MDDAEVIDPPSDGGAQQRCCSKEITTNQFNILQRFSVILFYE